jgi:hypothetical protein
MSKFLDRVSKNTLWGRVKELEEQVVVRNKYDDSSAFSRILSMTFSGNDTIGNKVAIVEKRLAEKIFAQRVVVNVKYSLTDEDGDEYTASHGVALDDLCNTILAHCGLEILPPDTNVRVKSKKKLK